MANPSIRIGRGSGQPVGFPDFKPMNPWGRAMPKPVRQPRPDLYQIVVRRHGVEIRFGPAMIKDCVDQLVTAIETSIRLGVEKELSEPHIVKCV